MADVTRSTTLSDDGRAFLEAHTFATIATLNEDGSPHQVVIWYLVRGDSFVINSVAERHWPRNLRRDPRISGIVSEGYQWVGFDGRAEVVDDPEQGQADMAEVTRRYIEDPEVAEQIIARCRSERRVSFRLRPTAIHAEISGG